MELSFSQFALLINALCDALLARFMHLIWLAKANQRKDKQTMKQNSESAAILANQADQRGSFGFLMNELNRLFDYPVPSVSSHGWNPVSAHETESGYRYDLELPGLKKDELKVSLTDGVLAVKGRKRLFRDGEETTVDVERSLLVPEDVDPNGIRARYVDGVLTLEIAKREEARPKTIEVAVA
jgi:HSP20 family protein